eukprot:Sdes_comp16213_c0_seq2m5480
MPQVLRINPSSEIVFKLPFDKGSISSISLTNPSNSDVFFKVKTTAPKRYVVRPSSGKVGPKATLEISVFLQPTKEVEAKSKDKFLVQSIVSPSPDSNIETLWASTDKNDIGEAKLRCLFLPTDSSVEASSPPGSEPTLKNSTSAEISTKSNLSKVPSSEPLSSENVLSVPVNSAKPRSISVGSSTALTPSGELSSSKEKELVHQIESLKKQLLDAKSEGLRQRKPASDETSSSSQPMAAPRKGFFVLPQGQEVTLLHVVISLFLGLFMGYFLHEYIWAK